MVETLLVRIKAIDQFSGTFKKIQGEAAATGAKWRAAGLVAGVGIVAMGAGLAYCAKQASEAEKVMAQTRSVVKSTGGVANISAKQVEALANKYMNLSGVNDELIQSSMNTMLTFTQVRNEVGKGNDIFDQASLAALNLSIRLGKDLQSSTIMVGKALQDPIRGVTALRRAGVQLTEAQEKQIKAFVESNDLMSAQKLILAELETQMGGAAEAAGNTVAGAWARLKENLGNAAEKIGTALLPLLKDMADWLARQDWERVGNAIASFLRAVSKIPTAIKGVWNDLQRWTLGVMEDIVNMVFKLADVLEHVPGPIGKAWTGVKEDMVTALDGIDTELTELVYQEEKLSGATKANVAIVAGLFRNLGTDTTQSLADMLYKMRDAIRAGVPSTVRETSEHMRGILTTIVSAIPGCTQVTGQLVDQLTNTIRQADFYTATRERIHDMALAISQATGAPVSAIEAILNNMQGLVGSTDMTGAGKTLAEGIARGIGEGQSDAETATQNIVDAVRNICDTANVWIRVKTLFEQPPSVPSGEIGRGGNAGYVGGGAAGGGWDALTGYLDKFRAQPIDDVANAIVNLTNTNWALIRPLEKTIADYDTLIQQSELARLKAEQAGDVAGAEWWAQTKAAQENARAIAEIQLELNKAEQAQAGFNEETKKALAAWNAVNRIYRDTKNALADAEAQMNKYADAEAKLNALRGAQIKGEYARDDKSFAMQQKLQKLDLAIMRAEDKGQFEKAAELKLERDNLERKKQEYDLSTSIKYDPMHRAVEKQFRVPEMAFADILKGIKTQKGRKAAYNRWAKRVKALGERAATYEEWISGFTPGSSGGAGGGLTININAGAFAGTPAQAKRFASWINGYIKQEAKR